MDSRDFVGTKATLSTFTDNVIGILLGWLLHIFLSRSLGPSIYGQFSLIFVIFNIFISFFTAGVAFAVTRYTPLALEPKGVFNAGIRIEIIFDIFLYCIYFTLLNKICSFLSIYELRPYLIALGIMIMPHGIANVSLGYLKGQLEFIKILKINLIGNFTKIFFCISLVLLGYNLWGVISGLIIAEIVLFISVINIIKLHALKTISFFKEIIFSSLPFCLMSLSSFIMQRIDVICIRLLLPEYSQIGYYAAAARLGELLLFFLSIPYTHLLPVLSSHFQNENYADAQKSIQVAMRYCFLLALPLGTSIALHSKLIMSIVFSYNFSKGSGVLFIFSIGMLVFSLLSVFGLVLLANNKLWFLLKINILFIFFNVIFNIVLIPIFGIEGAAIATVISLILIGVSMFIYTYKSDLLKRRRISWFLPRRTIFNVLFATCIVIVIGKWIEVKTWYTLGLKIIMSMAIYISWLFLLKEINQEDKRIIRFLSKLDGI